ncbi:uncharacterized protein LOC113684588 [Pocillopora damicornis]|uniref:uncharacterized protein LOC113684588 n=1 Tax=Pocillopora damicornis TaxID=46731 RepID=UPI000F5558BD|nr:uncharacterized protein LOC113684588 [Pocillopora damicornis]
MVEAGVGTSSSTLLSPSSHKRKLVVRHSTVKFQEKKGALSSEFHSTSSTSESPQKKEQWEKSEQKTKIIKTRKLEGKMASAVAPSFRSTKETTNYARLCRLQVDVGAHILRETFDKSRPTGDLHTVLSSPPVHAGWRLRMA